MRLFRIRGEEFQYYLYQVANLSPQLIIPALAFFYKQTRINDFAVAFVTVGLLSAVLDWGSSTAGSRKLMGLSGAADNKIPLIKEYEFIRLCVFTFIMFGYTIFALVELSDISYKIICVFLGLLSAFLYPGWVILGSKMNPLVTKYVIYYRFFTIMSLFAFVAMVDGRELYAVFYFAVSLIGAFCVRTKVYIEKFGLVFPYKFVINKELFYSGAVLTAGSVLVYFVTGSGSALLINALFGSDVVDFLVSASFLSVIRFAFGIVFARLFILAPVGNYFTSLSKKTISVYLFAMSSIFLLSSCILWGLYRNENIVIIYSIMFSGFFFIWPSHVLVTSGILGAGNYRTWLRILLCAFILYSFIMTVGAKVGVSQPAFLAAFAVSLSEFLIFIMGLNNRGRNGFLQ